MIAKTINCDECHKEVLRGYALGHFQDDWNQRGDSLDGEVQFRGLKCLSEWSTRAVSEATELSNPDNLDPATCGKLRDPEVLGLVVSL